jgi:hypothetical protein
MVSMEKPNIAEEQVQRAATGFLNELFIGAESLVVADKDRSSPTMIMLRPAALSVGPRPNSQYLVEKYPNRSFNVLSSVAGWRVPGICDAMAGVFQQEPAIIANDDFGKPVDAADPAQRKNIANMKADFPNGSSVAWMSNKTQFIIHCPSQAVFDQLAGHFAAKGASREI